MFKLQNTALIVFYVFVWYFLFKSRLITTIFADGLFFTVLVFNFFLFANIKRFFPKSSVLKLVITLFYLVFIIFTVILFINKKDLIFDFANSVYILFMIINAGIFFVNFHKMYRTHNYYYIFTELIFVNNELLPFITVNWYKAVSVIYLLFVSACLILMRILEFFNLRVAYREVK